MKTKATIAATGLVLSLLATTATAVPTFNLAGDYTGEIEIKFANFESFSNLGANGEIQPGSVNFGTLEITSIQDPAGGNQLWNSGAQGAELTGVFRDITVQSVTPTAGGVDILSTGGLLDVYINPLGSFAAAGGFAQGLGGYGAGGCGVGGACYDGISNVVGGDLFLSLEWVPGVSLLDPTVTVAGTFTEDTLPATGTAQGFLRVTGGAYAENFDSNGFLGGAADMFAQNDFCTPGQPGCVTLDVAGGAAADGGWQLRSNDPVRAHFDVPEPGSLALIGLGLSALGFASKRRRI